VVAAHLQASSRPLGEADGRAAAPAVCRRPTDTEEFRRLLARLRAVVAEVGGVAVALEAQPLEPDNDMRLTATWNQARAAAYGELATESEKLVSEIDKECAEEKFTLAELDEEEAELEKLRSWHERIRARDVLGLRRRRGGGGVPRAGGGGGLAVHGSCLRPHARVTAMGGLRL
jgi:hypothetical protein